MRKIKLLLHDDQRVYFPLPNKKFHYLPHMLYKTFHIKHIFKILNFCPLWPEGLEMTEIWYSMICLANKLKSSEINPMVFNIVWSHKNSLSAYSLNKAV